MSDLDKMLAENAAPLPRTALSAQILARVQQAEPANDARLRPRWMTGIAVAAMALAAVIFVDPFAGQVTDEMNTTTDISEQWADAADVTGFADLYAWVEGTETETALDEDL